MGLALLSGLLLLLGADCVRLGMRRDVKDARRAELVGGGMLAIGLMLLGAGIHLTFA